MGKLITYETIDGDGEKTYGVINVEKLSEVRLYDSPNNVHEYIVLIMGGQPGTIPFKSREKAWDFYNRIVAAMKGETE